jgi:hypothetical protein
MLSGVLVTPFSIADRTSVSTVRNPVIPKTSALRIQWVVNAKKRPCWVIPSMDEVLLKNPPR